MLFLELLAQSLVQGSIYALIALGLTLVYGLLRILHVAHAGLFTLGAYLGVVVHNATGSLLMAFAAAMLGAGIGGVAMFRLAYPPLLDRPPYVALIASIGLSRHCQNSTPTSPALAARWMRSAISGASLANSHSMQAV